MPSEATVGEVSYLVLFVADPAVDAHADVLRSVARDVEGAGFFDDAGSPRTVGTYVQASSLDDAAARSLIDAVRGAAVELGVTFEVQLAEEVVGTVAGDEFRPVGRS
jgi:hypothetical protein